MKLVKISLLLILFLFLFCCSYRIALLEITQEESEQIYNSWRESLDAAAEDSILYAKTSLQIREECSGYAAFKKDRIALYLAFQGYNLLNSSQDSLKAEKSAKILRKKFPRSEETFKLARDEFYEKIYPVWSDDSLKVPVLKELLDKYPQTQWRRTIYQYLAYSLNQLGRIRELQTVLTDFRNAFTDDYLSYYLTAWYYDKNDLDPGKAEKYADQAFALSQNYQVLDHYPGEEWTLERRAARVNSGALLGRIMNRQKKFQETEELITGIITDNQLGVEDEATLASCYLQLAISCHEQGKEKQAIDSAIEALISGDSRNRYTPEADSLLQAILSETIYTGDKTIQFIRERRKYNNVEFTDITIEAGLNGIHASRIAWGDYDNDGYQDLLLNGCRLFQNVSGEHFREVTALVFPESFQSRGGLWADFDNDGDLDILTTDPELILLQDNGRFQNTEDGLGISDNDWPTEGAGLGDFDSNGFVDVYLANYESEGQYKKDQLFLNMGSGIFHDLSDSLDAVLQGEAALAGRGVNPGDFDNDGDLDIYVSNYRLNRNYLWVNDGEGNFTEEALVRGVSGEEKEGWWGHTIGSEWGDYNNDGNLDLITANLAHPRYIDISDMTMLYRNSGAPGFIFTDQRAAVGIRFEETHSEPAWGDLNNDGYLDLYLNDVYENRRSFLYVNDQGKSFKDVTYLAGVRYFNGWGVAFADVDNDGDLDILTAGGEIKLFRNDTPAAGNWLKFKIIAKDHSDGIGTRLTLYNADFLQIREVQGGKGTTNQHSLVQHFGVGSSEPPFTLKIRFPSGEKVTLPIRNVNQTYIIIEEDVLLIYG